MTAKIIDNEIIITLDISEKNILETDMVDIAEFVRNSLEVKFNDLIDRVTLEKTDKQPSKISKADKIALINSLNLPKAIDKNKT